MIDSNVIIDALDPGAAFHDWAFDEITKAGGDGFINAVVAAEIAARAESLVDLQDMMQILSLRIEPIDILGAYMAGQAFSLWITRGGRRGGMLPDFMIGAHAASLGAAVLTRDVRRFRSYFPDLDLITPETRP